MAEKRRDNKGRVLRSGESQRSDGKYEYKYADSNGERHSVYSWKLVATDKVPEGKQGGTSLRDMEKQIQKDLEDNLLIYQTRKMTLNSFWDQYIELKKELKESTRTNYIYMYDNYVRPDFGKKNITTIKYSDVKKFYISLIHDRGFKPNSMEIINTILHPVFTSAVRDGYIRSNPSDGVMADIKKSHTWEKPKRHALTEQQQTKFVEFTAQSYQYKHWLPLFTVLLGTGGRIGEILGLRWEDCDFQDNIININHTLIYRKYTGQTSLTASTADVTRIKHGLESIKRILIPCGIKLTDNVSFTTISHRAANAVKINKRATSRTSCYRTIFSILLNTVQRCFIFNRINKTIHIF